jgi:hypothetical protein
MEIDRSLGVSRLVRLMASHRGKSAHDRLLARLDRSVAEALELCERAEDLYPDDPDGALADAFRTALARPARDWMRRAEALLGTVRSGTDTVCGVRAIQLRRLVDTANVAAMRPADSRECWREFYRSARAIGAAGR